MNLPRPGLPASLTTIRFKTTFFVAALLATATITFYVITMNVLRGYLLGEVIQKAASVARAIADSAGYSFISGDILGLDHVIYEAGNRNSDFDYVAIIDAEGKVVVHSDMKQAGKMFVPTSGKVLKSADDGTSVTAAFEPPGQIGVTTPISFKGKGLGSVALGVNQSSLAAAEAEARRKLIFILAGVLLAGISGSIVLSSLLTRPIQELAKGVAALKGGRVPGVLRVHAADEMGLLTASFNEMSALITAQQADLRQYSAALAESYISMIRVVSAALDARDPYTRGHSERVSIMSLAIGRRLGLSKADLDELEVACLLHDVGKIKTPDAILRKSGGLDPEEYREMMRHAEYGAEILGKAPALLHLIPPVRHHHERHDGSGYPAGLKGEEIPLFAAIISVADAFDAMTSDRPYRTSRPAKEAMAELMAYAGTQFAPKLVNIFHGIVEQQGEESAVLRQLP